MRKATVEGTVQHSISTLTIRECSAYFGGLLKKDPMPDHAFLAKLHIFSREMCEGFFAQKIILVEGVTDKAIIEGVYQSFGRDNIAEGIVIISADGKTKMDKPFYIFNKLGIPTYAVFDFDANSGEKKPAANKLLQKIGGVEEPVDYPSGCFERCAAFERHLEGYTKEVCGDQWQQTFEIIADDLGLHVSELCKTPQAVSRVVENLRDNGTQFPMFEEIIKKVDELAAW